MNKTIAEQVRDNYYQFLMKKYGVTDLSNLIDNVITEQENIIREQLELDAMELSLVC